MSDIDYTPVDNSQQEIWRDFPDCDGLYAVSNMGRVRLNRNFHNYLAGSIRTGQPNADGYLRLSLTINGKRKKWFVHQLVAITFLSDRTSTHEVNHINTIKTDNRLTNLEWVTHQGNMHHAIQAGVWKPGSQTGVKNFNSKLDPIVVREIRGLYEAGGHTFASLASRYGVAKYTIELLVKRVTWKHVE